MNKNKYYTYVLYDNEIPFWVGKGQGRRALDSTRPNQTTNKYKKNILNKIYDEDRNVIIKYALKNVTEQEAYDKETELISTFGKICDDTGTLANITDGKCVVCDELIGRYKTKSNKLKPINLDDGNRKFKLSKEELITELKYMTQIEIAEKYGVGQCAVSVAVSRYNIQSPKREISDETRKKISESNTGRKVSDETKKKISKGNRKFKLSKEELLNELKYLSGRKVAKKYNVGESTVYRAKKRYNI